MGGYSIYARCLDGTDPCVRLEQYMAAEYGGERGWSVERCYMLREDYVHGGTEQAVASIRVDGWQWGPDEEIPAADLSEQKFELLSSEELEAIFMEGNYDEAS